MSFHSLGSSVHGARSGPAAIALVLVLAGCAKGESLTGGSGPTSDTGGAGATGGASSSTGGAPSGGGGAGPSTGGAGGETTGGGGSGGAGGAENKCGNGMLNAGEACDGALLGDATCVSIGQGFTGGDLACAGDCSFDVTGCTAPPNCGNGTLNAGEACDGALLGGANCASQGFSAGTISCTAGCTLDISQCYTCGNGTVEPAEVCDGANLEGATCQNLGHDGGTLACAANCKSLVETACTDCGDGLIEAPEVCDGANLGGKTCVTEGFSGGTLTCTACALNLSGCTGQTCGNGIIEGAEVCDGAALGGQTCVSQGFIGGTLACNGACNGYVTTQCTGSQCQNGADDDTDGFVDLADPGCTNAADNDEELFLPSCNGVGGPIYDVTFANTSLDVVVTGSTVGVPNAYSPTDFTDDCTSATSGELVVMYRVFNTMSAMTISTWNPGTTFDTVMYVRLGGCAAGAPEACNDDQLFFSTRSEMTLTNVVPGDYYIIVDGYAGAAGNVELTIDIPNAFGVN